MTDSETALDTFENDLGRKSDHLGNQNLVSEFPHSPHLFLLSEYRKETDPKRKCGGLSIMEAESETSGRIGRIGKSLVETPEGLDEAAWELEGCPSVAVDCETYNVHDFKMATRPFAAGTGLRLLSLAARIDGITKVWVCDLHKTGHDLGDLKEVLETKQLVLANASFDLTFLRRFCGIRATRVFDVLVAEKVLLNGRSGSQTKGFFGLADTLNRWFGVELDKTEQKGDWGSAFLTNDQIDYAANDVRYLHDLALKQVEAIESAKLGRIVNLEMRLIPALVDMRGEGVKIDSDLLKRRIVELERATDEAWLGVLAEFKANGFPQTFKWGQKKILLNALRHLGLQVDSTNKDILAAERKKAGSPKVLQMIHAFGKMDTELKQARQLVDWTDPDGRLRTDYKQLGAETGRLSSANPNLQNIQKEGSLRGVFTASGEGRVLVVGDYVGMEMCAAAVIAKEERLLEDLRAGRDIHLRTASRLFGKAEGEVTANERALGKLANFNLLFGGGAGVLLEKVAHFPDLNPTFEELDGLRNRWLNAFPSFKAWHDKNRWIDRDNPTAKRTLLGRRRLDIYSFTEALNLPVQGSCADVIKLAMVWFAEASAGKDCRLLLTTHDELLVECPESLAREVKDLLEGTMKKAFWRVFGEDAPVSVDVGWGRTWKQAKGKDAVK